MQEEYSNSKKEILRELEELAPELAALKRTEQKPAAEPEGYFSALPDQVWAKISAEIPVGEAAPQRQPKWLDQLIEQIRFLLQPQYALAMATVLLLVIAIGIFRTNAGEQAAIADAEAILDDSDLPEGAMYDYVMDNFEDYDLETIMEVAPEVPLDFELLESAGEEELDQVIDDLLEELGPISISDFM